MKNYTGVMLITFFLSIIPTTIFATGAYVLTSENQVVTDCRATVIKNKKKSSVYCNGEGYINFTTSPSNDSTVVFITNLEGLSSTSVSGFMFTSDTPYIVTLPYKNYQSTKLHKDLKRMSFKKIKKISSKHNKSLKKKIKKTKKTKKTKKKFLNDQDDQLPLNEITK